MTKIFWLAFAGGLGTLSRFALSEGVRSLCTWAGLPFGTWAVNILGCFLYGLVLEYFEARQFLSPQTGMLLLVGFMGAFTTFSTYIFESSALLRDGSYVLLGINLLGQNILGFLALFAGITLARLVP